jgi:hypothetical protein
MVRSALADKRIRECSLTGKVEAIVPGDKTMLMLKEHRQTGIVDLREVFAANVFPDKIRCCRQEYMNSKGGCQDSKMITLPDVIIGQVRGGSFFEAGETIEACYGEA